MRINEKLNLVVPIYDERDQVYAYVHSAPISREVFEANFLLISKTFAAIHGQGLGEIAGPRVAALLMREIARDMAGANSGSPALALLNEIRRLSNVIMRHEGRWDTLPFEDVASGNLIDGDDLAEVENALVFFTVVSAMHRKQTLAAMLPGAARLWSALITSLDSTAYRASLGTSTGTGPSGATSNPPAPALPSAPARGATLEIPGKAASSLPS